ncbi:MAG: 2'-5' RNA ligase family protein [Proteobacteria bacterium]|nr:2'-5' RNA ligase family protein [Pseudomonadota bacterium]
MLYVVAWPVLSEADDTALRRLRAQYHPGEAELVGPHFTLVFGAPPEREVALRTAIEQIRQRPFWFVLDRVVRFDRPPPAKVSCLYAVPADGAAELNVLYETLNPSGGDEAFEPHITLGLFQRAAEAEQVARIVERRHLPMHGRVEEIGLVRRVSGGLETVTRTRLSG